MEGRLQSFHGAVKPLGGARPAWKVLRVLGNLLSLSGFDYDSTEAVRRRRAPGRFRHRLNNTPVAANLDGLNPRMAWNAWASAAVSTRTRSCAVPIPCTATATPPTGGCGSAANC